VAIGPAESARAGRALDVFAAGTFSAAPVVVLRPETQAVAVFVAGDHSATGPCGPAYRRLLVTPPGGGHARALSARIPGFVDLPACTRIRVSPVVPLAAVPYLGEHHVSPRV
jgi:hypothetical protein